MLWPPDIHEAENTADGYVCVRQTILDEVSTFTLLNPSGQSAKAAFDFAHLALQ